MDREDSLLEKSVLNTCCYHLSFLGVDLSPILAMANFINNEELSIEDEGSASNHCQTRSKHFRD